MRLSAVIITYYPNLVELTKNIDSIITCVDRLIIWVNTPNGDEAKFNLDLSRNGEKLVRFGTGENVGIATALNKTIQWSIENGYTHILTMDQDSFFEEVCFINYKSYVEFYDNSNVGVFTPNIRYNGNLIYGMDTLYKELSFTITSGAIHPLRIFEETGLFYEDFFIDGVDYEFCFRIKQMGYKVICITNVILNQTFGYVSKTPLGFSTMNYSATRTYYIIRNHIILWKKYPKLYPDKMEFVKGHIVMRFFKVILGETNKMKKLKSILLGLRDGFLDKVGQVNI